MANSSRRYIDRNGKMFIPMNVDGGNWEDGFITTPKLLAIIFIIASYPLVCVLLSDNQAKPMGYVISLLFITFINQLLLRYIVFQERYFYKVYKSSKDQEITTPASFWNIASVKQTPEGDILTYSDGRLAVVVKLERDTIIGKPEDFKENHYDAISDFYKSLNQAKLHFVQLNIMEPAGNDPRIQNLDKLTRKSDNPNICKLMERQIGYTKNITRATLYESDYFVVYTNELDRVDYLIQDVTDALYILLDGGYVGYQILRAKDIIELIKKMYGVKYFNYTEATLDMYRLNGMKSEKPFIITGINFNSGDSAELDNVAKNKIYSMTSEAIGGSLNVNTISIKETVKSRGNKEFRGVDIDDISKGYTPDVPKPQGKFGRPGFGTPVTNRPGRKVQENHSQTQARFGIGTPINGDWSDSGYQENMGYQGYDDRASYDQYQGGQSNGSFDPNDEIIDF